jgi:DNA mismatch repair protein MutL
VVLETEDGFAIMDPHAAHERILYEKYMTDLASGHVITQGLLMPETLDLGPADAARLRKQIDLFRKLGFGISNFGGDSFIVDAVPAYFAHAAARTLIIETSRELEEGGARAGAERLMEDAAARAACRAAVKARDELNMEEIQQLLNDLAAARMPYTCPHGRPTLIFTSYRELARKFGREK